MDGDDDDVKPSLRVAIALGALLAGLCLWAGTAQAYEGINVFEMGPTTTQAGGHPDISLTMEWDDSIKKEGKESPPSNVCGCDDARIIIQHFPTGFTGNPHATPTCELAEFTVGRCPASSQIGTAEPLAAGTGGGNIESFGYVPMYNMTPHPDEASLTGFWVPLVAAPIFVRLSARTDSDYGLDAESSTIYHPLPFVNALKYTLWGVPASPVHDSQRFIPPLQGFGLCGLFGCSSEQVGTAANEPEIPYLLGPTTCGVPLTAEAAIEYYTTHYQDKNDSLAGGDRLPAAHLQPESERPADHRRGGLGLRSRRRPQGAAGTEPADPGAVGDQGADHHPARRVHDQRQRGRRQGELLRRRHRDRHPPRRHLSRVLEGGDALARQLGPAGADSGRDLPRRAEAGQPLSPDPRRRRLRHPHQARRLGASPTRRPVSCRSPSRTCPSRR